MWSINPVFIITLCIFVLEAVSEQNDTSNADNTKWQCEILLPVSAPIICFLFLLIFILLVFLIKMFTNIQKKFNSALRRRSINEESSALHQNNTLCVSPTSGDGADNSSSTSSGSPGGSLADLSTSSQRYVSLQECQKTSDYINVSEGRVDCKSKTSDIDYVNVKEPRRKKPNRKGQARFDKDTTRVSSDDSDASTVNYSKVVFTAKM